MKTNKELYEQLGLSRGKLRYQLAKLNEVEKDIEKINKRYGINVKLPKTEKQLLEALSSNNISFNSFKSYVSKQVSSVKEGFSVEVYEAQNEDLKEVNRITGNNYLLDDIIRLSDAEKDRVFDLMNYIANADESKKRQYMDGVYNEISAWVNEIENIFAMASINTRLISIDEESPFD